MAQAAPKVINVMTYDVAGDMPKFLGFYKQAMVVLLPEPVGPTTKSKPWGRSARRSSMSGSKSSLALGTSLGTARNAAAILPRWK